IVSAKDMRSEMIRTVVVHGRVRRRWIERGGINGAHLLPGLQPARSHVLPVLTAVAGELDEAAVSAHPDEIGTLGRRRDGADDAIAARPRLLAGHLAVAILGIVLFAGEVGRDDVPVVTFVGGAEEDLGS